MMHTNMTENPMMHTNMTPKQMMVSKMPSDKEQMIKALCEMQEDVYKMQCKIAFLKCLLCS